MDPKDIIGDAEDIEAILDEIGKTKSSEETTQQKGSAQTQKTREEGTDRPAKRRGRSSAQTASRTRRPARSPQNDDDPDAEMDDDIDDGDGDYPHGFEKRDRGEDGRPFDVPEENRDNMFKRGNYDPSSFSKQDYGYDDRFYRSQNRESDCDRYSPQGSSSKGYRPLSNEQLGELLNENVWGFALGVKLGSYLGMIDSPDLANEAHFIRTDVRRFVEEKGRHRFRSIRCDDIQNFIDECMGSDDVLGEDDYIQERFLRDGDHMRGSTIESLIEEARQYHRVRPRRDPYG